MLAKIKNRGFVLIASYMVIVVLIILAVAFIAKSVSEANLARRKQRFIQALYLAEAGIDYAIVELRNGTSEANPVATSLSTIGDYDCQWALKSGSTSIWVVTSKGIVGDTEREVRVEMEKKDLPENFYDSALYICDDITFNGKSYQVNGDVVYGDELSGSTEYVTGTITQDPSINPLVSLDFAQLRDISAGQGNVYDAERLADDFLPTSFWYDEPAAIPNVVYIETDLTLRGNIGDVGGFFIVVGDVLTNPSATQDTTINGNGEIDGCIYTTGEFTVNGGGNGLNVNGAVWAGEESTLNGNVNITYNGTYMSAIDGLSLSTDYQLILWEEL